MKSENSEKYRQNKLKAVEGEVDVWVKGKPI
jgi:hypothetical protein